MNVDDNAQTPSNSKSNVDPTKTQIELHSLCKYIVYTTTKNVEDNKLKQIKYIESNFIHPSYDFIGHDFAIHNGILLIFVHFSSQKGQDLALKFTDKDNTSAKFTIFDKK